VSGGLDSDRPLAFPPSYHCYNEEHYPEIARESSSNDDCCAKFNYRQARHDCLTPGQDHSQLLRVQMKDGTMSTCLALCYRKPRWGKEKGKGEGSFVESMKKRTRPVAREK
jgi:hypothetical protein